MYKGPKKLLAVKVANCDLILTEFFNEENTTNISIGECAISIRNNQTSLIEIISKCISPKTIASIKTKLYFLNKFQKISIPLCLIECVQNSSQKKELIKYMLNNLKDQDFQQIAAHYHNDIDYISYINYEELLRDGNILLEIKQFQNFFDKIKQQLQARVNKDSKINEEYFIETLHILQIESEICTQLIEKYVKQNIKSYEMLEKLIEQSLKIQQFKYVSVVQMCIEDLLKQEELIYDLAESFVEKDQIHPFVQKYMLSKLNSSQQFQQYLLQLITSQIIVKDKFHNKIFNCYECIQGIKFYEEIILVSNYYWNCGQSCQEIQDPLKNVQLPLAQQIQQKFNQLPKQNHQKIQLFAVILQVSYKSQMLYITIQEYVILQMFLKNDKAKIKDNLGTNRLLELGVLRKLTLFEYEIREEKLQTLSLFSFIQKPKNQKREQSIQIYEQNKILIMEAGIMKIMKKEKKLSQVLLQQKLQLLVKKSLVVTDVEMIESVRGLVKRDLLYHENEQIFYNI